MLRQLRYKVNLWVLQLYLQINVTFELSCSQYVTIVTVTTVNIKDGDFHNKPESLIATDTLFNEWKN